MSGAGVSRTGQSEEGLGDSTDQGLCVCVCVCVNINEGAINLSVNASSSTLLNYVFCCVLSLHKGSDFYLILTSVYYTPLSPSFSLTLSLQVTLKLQESEVEHVLQDQPLLSIYCTETEHK